MSEQEQDTFGMFHIKLHPPGVKCSPPAVEQEETEGEEDA